MGRLVRRTEPDPGKRRHNRPPWLRGRPGRAAWVAWQSARFGLATGLRYAGRLQSDEHLDQGEKHENHSLEPPPWGRFISYGGRKYFRRRRADPSTSNRFVSHHQHVDNRPLVDHRHVVLRPAWHCGHLRQASESGRLVRSGGLSPAELLVCARDGLYLLR